MLFEFAVHGSILASMIQQSHETYTQPILDTVKGTLMQGNAKTDAHIQVSPYPESRGAGIAVSVDSITRTSTFNRNIPRNDVLVQFNWSIDTAARTTTQAYITETGITSFASRTVASSRLTLHDLSTYASGLLRRFKSRVAYNKALNVIHRSSAESEMRASHRISQELDKKVDEKVAEMLRPLESKLQAKILRPIADLNALGEGGKLRLMSMADRFFVSGLRAGDTYTQPRFDTLSEVQPMQGRLHGGWIELIFSRILGGAIFADGDVIDFIEKSLGTKPKETEEDPESVLPSPEEVLMTFSRVRPLQFTFGSGDVLTLSLNCERMETRGQTYKDVSLRQNIRLHTNPDGSFAAELGLSHELVSGTAIDTRIKAHVQRRMDVLFKLASLRLAMGLKHLARAVVFQDMAPLRIATIGSDAEGFTVSFQRDQKGGIR